MSDERLPPRRGERAAGKSFLYEKGVPVILAVLALIAVIVFLAAVAVILGILPA